MNERKLINNLEHNVSRVVKDRAIALVRDVIDGGGVNGMEQPLEAALERAALEERKAKAIDDCRARRERREERRKERENSRGGTPSKRQMVASRPNRVA